jgi:D-glycero-D-manno-heptose 1,7-bisphosphate phosphatase
LTQAVFFDRDGIVNELVPDPRSGLPESPLRVDDVRLVPGAADGLRRLREAGFALVGVSNQPSAAKGTISLDELERIQARVLELLEVERVVPDGFYICFHHPYGSVPGLSGVCDCRKPAPGLLIRAGAELEIELTQSWLVGDTDADIEAGRAAGCRTILVDHPGSAHKRGGVVSPDARVSDLRAAVNEIVVLAAR